jgi:hypothetical protein
MSRHHIDTTHEASDGTKTLLRVFFVFHAYVPERGPSYASGGEPEEPASVEFLDVSSRDGNRWRVAPEFDDWAAEWLETEGLADAIETARADVTEAEEARAEMRRDCIMERKR